MRDGNSLLIQIQLYKMRHIIADADKYFRKCLHGAKEASQILLIGIDAKTIRETEIGINIKMIILHAEAEAFKSIRVRARIADISDESNLLSAFFNNVIRESADGIHTLQQKEIALYLFRRHSRDRIKKYLRYWKVINHPY